MTATTADVLTYKEGLAGRLRLNRPKALHSLNRQMVRDMARALIEWRDDPDVRIILIDHAEGRGFCAGGDVVDISQNVEGAEAAARAFFFDEYRLEPPRIYLPQARGRVHGRSDDGRRGRHRLPLPLPRRDRANRAGHARDDDRHLP